MQVGPPYCTLELAGPLFHKTQALGLLYNVALERRSAEAVAFNTASAIYWQKRRERTLIRVAVQYTSRATAT